MDQCALCKKIIRKRQEALQCDKCDRWQHRTCNTDISRSFYRKLVKGLEAFPAWHCFECQQEKTSQQIITNHQKSFSTRENSTQYSITTDAAGFGAKQSTSKEILSSSCSRNVTAIEYKDAKETEEVAPDNHLRINFPFIHEYANTSPTKSQDQASTPLEERNRNEHENSMLHLNNQTFIVENVVYSNLPGLDEVEVNFVESSVSDDDLDVIESSSHNVSYHIEENCSNRGKPKLFDNLGFEYTLHRKASAGNTWRCAVRNKKMKCGVLIKQKGLKFARPPSQTHCHQPKLGAKEAAKVIKMSKIKAAQTPFVPASKIIRETMQQQEIQPSRCEALLPMENMIRNVNNYRKCLRPQDPRSKEFELVIESLPSDFLLEDIH